MRERQRFLLVHAWSILLVYIGAVTTGLALVHAALTGRFGFVSVIGLLPLPALVLAGYLNWKNTRLERDLREKKEALEAVNQELADYTYMVSHELKEPLRSLRIFAHFLLEDYGERLDEQGQDYLQRIHRAAVRMGSLVDDLLWLSRIGREDISFEAVDLNEVVADVREELAALVGEANAEVNASRLPVVPCQRRLMSEIFKNVIANGVRFNDEQRPVVEVSSAEYDGAYRISIRDNGIGIEGEKLDAIFGIFTQLHPREKYGGTGAGLAICKKIIEVHDGSIWAESTPGEGTTFHFTIPKTVPEES